MNHGQRKTMGFTVNAATDASGEDLNWTLSARLTPEQQNRHQ